jgi:hypothetical protein
MVTYTMWFLIQLKSLMLVFSLVFFKDAAYIFHN